MESTLRRTWAEIDLDALAHNYQTLRRRTETRFVGVVKADAYGHGSVQVSRVLEELGRTIWRCPVWTRPWSCGPGVSICPF